MSTLIFLLVFSLLAPWSFAESVPDMPADLLADREATIAAARAATAARFPDADSVIVDDRIHTRYEPDGSDVTWDDEWVKVLTEKGRRAHAAVSLDFNARYGDAGILCVEIVGTNGTVRTVDFAQTLKDATDNSSMSANIVDPQDRTLSCAVSGLAIGEIRHVRFWRRTLRARMKNAWADLNLLEQTQPLLATTISIDQPAGRPLAHAVVRNPQGKSLTRAPDRELPGGRRLLSWTARDVPQAFREPNMPPLSRCLQTLRVSTIADWPTVSKWYWSLCESHLAKTTPAMTNAVADLVKGCADEDAKVRALFRFVSQEVRYMGLTLEDDAPGYEPHDVDVTFGNRYGVCRDKAALLVALLRVAGVRAFPVLIHAGAKMDPEVPMPYFNHAIVAVEKSSAAPRSYQLMDPTDETTKDLCPAYLSDKSYLVARPEGEGLLTSPVPSCSANLLRVSSEGTLDGEGDALLTTSFAFGGINDTAVRHSLVKKTPLERRQWFEGIWRSVAAGAELLSLELTPEDLRDTDVPLAAKTVVRLPESVRRGRTRDALSVPFATTVLSVVNGILDENTALEKRRFPLVLPCTAASEETLRLALGDAVDAPSAPPEEKTARAAGYAFSRAIACTNGVLTARRTMRVEDVNFDVDGYTALRNARKDAETFERDEPLFAARANADADVRVRLRRTETHLLSPTAWVSTNTVEKEILTYRGKKNSSELKFSYAPSTRRVELVSATVSNRNGKVFSVTPREINVMDCGWASSAPRYPASKILVANLPGVEIGSVVRTVVAYTVTDAPVAQAYSYTFGGRDPYDREEVEIHVPDGVRFAFRNGRHLPAKAFSVTTNVGSRVFRWSMREPMREPMESSQPSAAHWRPTFSVSQADWEEYGTSFTTALAAARGEGEGWFGDADTQSENARRLARSCTATCSTPSEMITAIRTELRRLRVVGPGLFELPFDRAFTAPDRVLAEGYGSAADRMNLLYAMLEAAGFDCTFAFVAGDARSFRGKEAEWRRMPRPGMFGTLAIRAVWRTGWVPFLRDEETFWIAGENEYTPPEASSLFGNSWFDPAHNAFGLVDLPADAKWTAHDDNFCRMEIRANGAVDFSVTNRTYGAGVGGLRKTFTELLPEMRSRFYQKLLGNLAQNATATGPFATDVKGYPFALSFSAYAEDYAVVRQNALTVKIPDFTGRLFDVAAGRRRAPIVLNGKDEVVDTYEIVFPEGYTQIERLPDALTLVNPNDAKDVWMRQEVKSRLEGKRLVVTVRRRVARAKAVQLGSDFNPYLLDWNRRAAAKSARAVTVRREK